MLHPEFQHTFDLGNNVKRSFHHDLFFFCHGRLLQSMLLLFLVDVGADWVYAYPKNGMNEQRKKRKTKKKTDGGCKNERNCQTDTRHLEAAAATTTITRTNFTTMPSLKRRMTKKINKTINYFGEKSQRD